MHFPRFKWIEDPCNLLSWVFFKIKWNDGMMTWCNAKINRASKRNTPWSWNIWKASEASVSGRYNTPPLREDLVPRSRMAPEINGRGTCKTSCFFDKRVKPKNLERLKTWKKNTMEMNAIANTPLDKRNLGYDENQEVKWQDRYLNHSG